MIRKNEKNYLISQGTNSTATALCFNNFFADSAKKRKLSKMLSSNQNTISGSDFMISNTQDDETMQNLDLYNGKATKFLHTKNTSENTNQITVTQLPSQREVLGERRDHSNRQSSILEYD